jgi:hypothetical protein
MKRIAGLKAACILFALSAFIAAASYAADKEAAGKDFTYETAHYSVHTDTSPETAEYIGKLMEEALGEYRRVTGGGPRILPNDPQYSSAVSSQARAIPSKNGSGTGPGASAD